MWNWFINYNYRCMYVCSCHCGKSYCDSLDNCFKTIRFDSFLLTSLGIHSILSMYVCMSRTAYSEYAQACAGAIVSVRVVARSTPDKEARFSLNCVQCLNNVCSTCDSTPVAYCCPLLQGREKHAIILSCVRAKATSGSIG